MNAIEINNLDFSYNRKELLLRDVNMNIPKGIIYGFLGPNGAGKTTTLKLILNLLKIKSKGVIHVMGENISKHYPTYLNNIGSLIEDASIYDHLTAKDNLRIWSHMFNSTDKRISEVLEIVGLSHAINKKVQAFSTGMKQRLGIGIAIMHDPQILILDEPTNGLDPIGISDLRILMRNLTDQGKTILLSSHILSEVEKMVDYLGILKDGSVVFEGTLKQLNSHNKLDATVIAIVDKSDAAFQLLRQHYTTKIVDEQLVINIRSKNDINHIARVIIENDIQLFEIKKPKKNLETLFMKLANN